MRIMVTITPICSTAISEDIVQNINKSFPLFTTCLSTTNALVYRAAKLCNEQNTAAFERFAIKYDGYFYNIRKNCPLKRLLLFLGNSNAITLYYRIGIGGGLGLGEEKGIRYFFIKLAIEATIIPNVLNVVAYPKILPILVLFLALLGTIISHPGSICFLPLPFTLVTWPFI